MIINATVIEPADITPFDRFVCEFAEEDGVIREVYYNPVSDEYKAIEYLNPEADSIILHTDWDCDYKVYLDDRAGVEVAYSLMEKGIPWC